MSAAPKASPPRPPALDSLLAAPGGGGPLRQEEDAFVSAAGERFVIDEGVVRMLGPVDPALGRELDAQAAAVDDYADPGLLMPRYEHRVAAAAVEGLLGRRSSQGAAILDAGCGIGLLGRLYPGLDLIGVDASLPLLRRARAGYRGLIEASAEALPFGAETFDVVLALNMLHHVIDPARAVGEFARVLRPGGLLIAVDPRKVAPIELAKRLLRRQDPTFAETHRAFEVGEYARLAGASGAFVIEEFRRVGLVGLVAMGGLDATRLSPRLPAPDLVVRLLAGADRALARLPGGPQAGLNLMIRARRAGPAGPG